jgi:hypothetical protein
MAKENWLLHEIEKAASETRRWPDWMQSYELWHPVLAHRLAEQTAPQRRRRSLSKGGEQPRLNA